MVAAPAGASPAAQTAAATASRSEQPTHVRDGLGRTRLVGATAGRRLAAAPRGTRGPAQAAQVHARRWVTRFGSAATSTLRTLRVSGTATGSVVHLQQTVAGVPVVAGEVVVAMDERTALLSVSGETSRRIDSTAYVLPASRAVTVARRAVARGHGLAGRDLHVARPTRWLYDPSLVDPRGADGARAVWRAEVTSPVHPLVRDLVLVDARSGRVALRLDQVAHATNRVVCDGADVPAPEPDCRPGRYSRTEGAAPTGVADVDQAYDHTGAAADWFQSRLGLDLTAMIGVDRGDGPRIRSTVRFCPEEGCPFDNAYWTGEQMVYGTGFAAADDVVAHELTHGVTERTAGLMYWFQSGAINESMSDVFGELVDQVDGLGDDSPAVRWQLGEDLGPRAGGVTRHMADPTAYGQPDHTGSDLYDFAPDYDDNGGVHTNSGVPNKTAYLVVDGTAGEPGGAFNGASFPGIGPDKAAAVYWASLQMLTPGADFTDLAAVLRQSCANLAGAGTAGLTTADCSSVAAAAAATGLERWTGPSRPRQVSMTGLPRGVALAWRAPRTSGSSPLTSYAVHIRPAVGVDDFFSLEPGSRAVRLGGLRAGTDYTVGLVAVTADGTSPSVVRTFRGTSLLVEWPGGGVRFGSALRVPGTLTDATGSGIVGRTVQLLERAPGRRAYRRVAVAPTAADGGFRLRTRPARGARYRVVFDGSAGEVGARTRAVWVPVAQQVSLAVAPSVRLGELARFTGSVRPGRAGGPVRLQRRLEGAAWRTVTRGRVDGGGGFDLVARVTSRRSAAWRVQVPARGAEGLAAGISRVVTLAVR